MDSGLYDDNDGVKVKYAQCTPLEPNMVTYLDVRCTLRV